MSTDEKPAALIFNVARKIESPKERSAYLEEACGSNLILRALVEKLLVGFGNETRVQGNFDSDSSGLTSSSDQESDGESQDGYLPIADEDVFDGSPNLTLSDSPEIDLQSVTLDDSARTRNQETRIEIHGEIARGGMGAIMKGRDRNLGRQIAIKVLLNPHKCSPKMIRRFYDEAQIGGQLQHPGIAPVYELGRLTDGRPFFSMKLVQGKTLAELLSERKSPTDDRAKLLAILEQVCQTIAYAHSRCVIHRDVKPSNIMVGAFGEVQVMDWGLAKVLTAVAKGEGTAEGDTANEDSGKNETGDASQVPKPPLVQGNRDPMTDQESEVDDSRTQIGSVMGTPSYMPPEQAAGDIEMLDERADVFGLGAVLCEILTGDPAYVAEDDASVLQLARIGNLTGAHARLDACDADQALVLLAKDCLQKEPLRRPRNAGEVANRVAQHAQSVNAKLREAEQRSAVAEATAIEERKRRRLQAVMAVSAILIFGFAVSGWRYLEHRAASQQRMLEAQNKVELDIAEASRLVQGLLQAETSQLKPAMEELSRYRDYAREELVEAFLEAPKQSPRKLHAGLALLEFGSDIRPSVMAYLEECQLFVNAEQFLMVGEILMPYRQRMSEVYWQIALDPGREANLRFRAACALATYDPDNEYWGNQDFVGTTVADFLHVLPADTVFWREALQPVKQRLVEPFTMYYLDDPTQIELNLELTPALATDTLVFFLQDDPDGLFQLLVDANPLQFAILYEELSKHRNQTVELAKAELAKLMAGSDKDQDDLAIKKANAAAVLYRMGESESVWPLLKHSADPRVRSFVIRFLGSRGGTPQAILDRLQAEPEASIKSALLLSLSRFSVNSFSQVQVQQLIGSLQEAIVVQEDPGLRASANWFLRSLGAPESPAASAIAPLEDQEEIAFKGGAVGTRYLDWLGQSFVILDADEFRMGHDENDLDALLDERGHRRRINRRFAIATTEVTAGQWAEFSRSNEVQSIGVAEDPSQPQSGMSWFEAVQFCNWLSERDGIPQDQWCYEPNDEGEYGEGMRSKSNFLELQGYRLPTEAEWEFACRAGTTTSRFYGNSTDLLADFARYFAPDELDQDSDARPETARVGSYFPNHFGLFDMYGNVSEWTHGFVGEYPIDGDVASDEPQSRPIAVTEIGIVRGGSVFDPAWLLKSHRRSQNVVTNRRPEVGFRVARTIRGKPDGGSENDDVNEPAVE